MKNGFSKYLILLLMLVVSCGGPDALVINRVNSDGSIDRRIILTWDNEEFDLDDCQVPIDSTWAILRSLEISEKGDTTYILTADKHFTSVKEINADYRAYKGSNELLTREAGFKRSFRWFNTVYYFSEIVKGAFDGYSPEDYFTPAELNLFFMPQGLIDELKSGPDSTSIKDKETILNERSESWMGLCISKGVIDAVEDLSKEGIGEEIDIGVLREREREIAKAINDIDGDEVDIIDTVFGKGFYERHRVILDTSLAVIEKKLDVAMNVDKYLIQATMPGELIATNGYLDNESKILWEVDGDCILASDYTMWAESKEVNMWAWIVTLLFLIFVISGVVRRVARKEV